MSKGPGKVERAVQDLFESDPTGAWLIDDIVWHVWPDNDYPLPRSQLVSARRAAKNVAQRLDWDTWRSGIFTRRGAPMAYYNPYNVMSYALARVKTDHEYWALEFSEADWRAKLDKDDNQRCIEPGGAWWIHTEQRIAKRDGDEARLAELDAMMEELRERVQEAIAGLGR